MRPRFLLLLLAAVLALAAVPAAVAVSPPEPDFGQLIRHINQLGVDDPNINPQPFLASAMAAERAFMRGNCNAALGALGALENKLDAQLGGVGDPNIQPLMDDIARIRAALQQPPEPELPPGPC